MRVSESLVLTARAWATKAEELRRQTLRSKEAAESFAVFARYGARSAEEKSLLEAKSARLQKEALDAELQSVSAAGFATQLQARAQRLAVRGE